MMDLIEYLNNNFYEKKDLLEKSELSELEFKNYQKQGLMPLCSYRLSLASNCESYFGQYSENQDLEYYAKGYISWLATIRSAKSIDTIYAGFSERYLQKALLLQDKYPLSEESIEHVGTQAHLEEAWKYFLDGTYGLCTKSGLPEDIAAKALAIFDINNLIATDELPGEGVARLAKLVDLLDSASSLFAPHERLKSSRHRLIDELRREFDF